MMTLDDVWYIRALLNSRLTFVLGRTCECGELEADKIRELLADLPEVEGPAKLPLHTCVHMMPRPSDNRRPWTRERMREVFGPSLCGYGFEDEHRRRTLEWIAAGKPAGDIKW